MRVSKVPSTIGAGANAPMPPVLGPVPPSPIGLWSCDGVSNTYCDPSVRAKTLTSSPTMHSSMTTRSPAGPKARSFTISSSASWASSRVEQTYEPLPAASPSALTTMGAPTSSRYPTASSYSSAAKTRNVGVGTSWRSMNRSANALLPSSWAASAGGPTMRSPAFLNRSTRPSTRGCSGPTMVRSISSSRARATRPSKLSDATSTFVACCAVPGLPGAA